MMQVPAAVKEAAPVEETPHATLEASAENVMAPPAAEAVAV
jgi:hypothetical protein